MDHPGSLSPPLAAQPWRLAAFVAAAIAALELLLLVVVGLAFAAKPLAREAEDAVAGRAATAGVTAESGRLPSSSAPAPALSRVETSVLVLNGNGLPGAAAATAERVRGRGYLVAGTANAPRSDFPRSLVMYRPGFRAEAARLAADLRVTRVAPLDGLRAADLQGAHVALILGAS